MLTHPWVKLDIIIEDHLLDFRISNNKPEQKNDPAAKKGIGLTNVKKRLQLLYPGTHSLHITENDMSYEVAMKIALDVPVENSKQVVNHEEKKVYELA